MKHNRKANHHEHQDVLLSQGPSTGGFAIKHSNVGKANAKTLEDPYKLDLSFTPKGIQDLIDALEPLVDSENGAKLQIYFGKKKSKDGKLFTSAFMFIKRLMTKEEAQKKFRERQAETKGTTSTSAAEVAKTLG